MNNHAHVIESSDICDAKWFYNYFRHRNIKRNLTRQGAGRYKLNKETLERIPILIPPKKEQIEINAIFRTWDTAIEKTEKLIEAKEKLFSWLLSELISKSKYFRGHIRDFTIEVSKRNSGGVIDRILSVTNNRGFVLPEDQFERRLASSDLSNYKVVTRAQYAYYRPWRNSVSPPVTETAKDNCRHPQFRPTGDRFYEKTGGSLSQTKTWTDAEIANRPVASEGK